MLFYIIKIFFHFLIFFWFLIFILLFILKRNMTSKTLQSPIFALYIIGNNIIVASGGGNIKFGVKNKLLLFNIKGGNLSEAIFEKEMGNDIPIFISGIPEKNIFLTCINNKTVFYLISNNKFEQIYEFKSIETFSEDIFQSCVSIDKEDLCTGSSTGELKYYNIKINNNKIESINLISSNLNAHLRIINNLIIIKKEKYKFVVTASGDGTCKVFDIYSNNIKIKELSKFSFRETLTETANYFMRDILYDSNSENIFTLQSPLRGNTYLTKWSFKNVNLITPLKTVEICAATGFSCAMTNNKNLIGITNSEGSIIFVDCNEMKINSKISLGENMIKCGMFYQDQYYITGSIDNYLRSSVAKYNGFNYFSFMFKFIIFGLICFDIYRRKYRE